MTLAAHSDRFEFGTRWTGIYFNTSKHPPFVIGSEQPGQSARAYFDRPASGATMPFRDEFVRPSRYHLARVRRISSPADCWVHGGPADPFCVRSVGHMSVQEAYGAELMLRGWDDTTKMPLVPNYLIAKADGKCLEGIQVNIAEHFAEYTSSLKSMSNLLTKGMHYLMKFKGLMVRIKNPKILADAWLSYQFGLKPLISDIVKLSDFNVKKPGFVISRGQASEKWDSTGVLLYNNIWVQTNGVENTRWGCNTQVAYTIDSPLFATMASLGLANPVLLAWELIPFSFVVDWFVNVGSMVASINQGAGLSFLWGSRTRWLRPDYKVSWRPAHSLSQSFSGKGYSEQCAGGLFYHREVLDHFPIPPLYFRPNLNLTKLLDVIALLRR